MALRKPKRYSQRFLSAYTTEFPCITPSNKGQNFAFCSICRCHLNIAHGGKQDITVHLSSQKHRNNLKCDEQNNRLDTFLVKEIENNVIRAECLFTAFILEHNLPISIADHAGPLFRKMFPQCEDAKKYGCGRTKTSAVISEMAYKAKSSLASYLKEGPFSIATDGSNDSDSKLYPIVVTYPNSETQKIESCILCVPALNGDATGRNVGNLVIDSLKAMGIPLSNCLAFSADNANVMIGLKNGVAAVLKENNKNLIVMGCPCHLINLAAEKGASALPVKMDEILTDIYYYLEKSSKRKESLKKFQNMHDVEARKILKHVATRWLSLGKCLSRLLDQWDPLVSFFHGEVKNSQKITGFLETYQIPKKPLARKSTDVTDQQHCGESSSSSRKREAEMVVIQHLPKKKKKLQDFGKLDAVSREERLFLFLTSDLNKAHCLFLQHVIPVFDKTNCMLQSQIPHIHVLRELLLDMLKELLTKFVKPSVVKRCKSLLEIDYHSLSNQKDDDNLVIGVSATKVACTLCPGERKSFYLAVRNFFIQSSDYVRHKFPLTNEVLKNAEVALIPSIESASFNTMKYFVDRFPGILPCKAGESIDKALDALQAEFAKLQVEELPSNILKEDRIDVQWSVVGTMKGPDGQLKYNRVAKVVLAILTIPHSNAECERIFSHVKKIRTQFRTSMSNTTLENMLIVKCTQQGKCYEQKFDTTFLKRAKSATCMALAK